MLAILPISRLLQRDEPRRVRGTDTRPSVLDGVVGDRELAKVVTDHLRLDLDRVELLAGVDANDRTNHLRDHNHVAKVCLDGVGLFVRLGLLLRLAQLLDQTHGLALQAAVESAAGAGVDDIAELLTGEVEEPGALGQSQPPERLDGRRQAPLVQGDVR